MPAPADWNLPPGVSRELWDYFQDTRHAEEYDATLVDTPLLTFDQEYVDRWLKPNSRILDLGCGTGRAAVRLARQGHFVVGVDLSESMLKQTGWKADGSNARVHTLKANIAQLDCLADQSFDLVLCLFSTFGMIHGDDARTKAMTHVARILKPGGRLILHVHNRWWTFWSRYTFWWAVRSLFTWSQPNGGDFAMPPHDGRPGWTMHLFTESEVAGYLQRPAGLLIRDICRIGFRGPLPVPWLLGGIRAYGMMVMAEREG